MVQNNENTSDTRDKQRDISQPFDISKNDILSYIHEHDITELPTICGIVKDGLDKQYLAMHNFSIWQSEHKGKKKWFTYLLDENVKRKQIMRSKKVELEKVIIEYYKGKEDAPPNIETTFEEWIDYKLEYDGITKQTYDKYKNNFKRFFVNNSDASEIMNTPIACIDDDLLEHFIKKTIIDMHLARKTYSDMKILLIGIFQFAKKRRYTSFSISNFIGDLSLSRNIFTIHKKDRNQMIYNESECGIFVDYLKQHMKDIRFLAILLQFQTGLRVGKLCAIKYTDLDNRVLHIQRTEVHYKGEDGHNCYSIQDHRKSSAGNREVILPDTAIETITAMKKLNPDGEYLIMENGKIIKSSGIRRKIKRICESLNIDYKSSHAIRRLYATTLIDAGVSDSNVMSQLGHESIETSRRYYYFSKATQLTKISEILSAVTI